MKLKRKNRTPLSKGTNSHGDYSKYILRISSRRWRRVETHMRQPSIPENNSDFCHNICTIESGLFVPQPLSLSEFQRNTARKKLQSSSYETKQNKIQRRTFSALSKQRKKRKKNDRIQAMKKIAKYKSHHDKNNNNHTKS